jgi:hypothetical protein
MMKQQEGDSADAPKKEGDEDKAAADLLKGLQSSDK